MPKNNNMSSTRYYCLYGLLFMAVFTLIATRMACNNIMKRMAAATKEEEMTSKGGLLRSIEASTTRRVFEDDNNDAAAEAPETVEDRKKAVSVDGSSSSATSRTNEPSVLMIVAHPDDETLWGGDLLLREGRNVHVVVTCTQNSKIRHKEFNAVSRHAGFHGEFLDGQDTLHPGPHLEPRIVERIESLVCRGRRGNTAGGWDQIITHGPEGEYGHPQHQVVHDAVYAAVKKCHNHDKLFVFEPYPVKDYVLPQNKVTMAKLHKSQDWVIETYGHWKEHIVPYNEYNFQRASDTCKANAVGKKPCQCRLDKVLDFTSSSHQTAAQQWEKLMAAER